MGVSNRAVSRFCDSPVRATLQIRVRRGSAAVFRERNAARCKHFALSAVKESLAAFGFGVSVHFIGNFNANIGILERAATENVSGVGCARKFVIVRGGRIARGCRNNSVVAAAVFGEVHFARLNGRVGRSGGGGADGFRGCVGDW